MDTQIIVNEDAIKQIGESLKYLRENIHLKTDAEVEEIIGQIYVLEEQQQLLIALIQSCL